MNTVIRPIHATTLAAACALLFNAPIASAQRVTNFANATPITIVDNTVANPYPSAIEVAGLRGEVTAVRVTLNQLSHTFPADIDVKLVSPQGQQVMLMSDAGAGTDVVGVTLTFSASAAASLAAPITSGTWRPTNAGSDADTFPAPAPAGTPGINLEVFNGPAASQTGTWQLFIRDDLNLDIGSIATGWTLSFTTEFVSCADEGYTGAKLTMCRRVCEVDNPPATLTSLIRLYRAMFREDPPCGT